MENKNYSPHPSSHVSRPSSRAFTLIEMLVVVVVIGILATLVVVSVAGGRKKALAAKAKSDMTELAKAFEMAASEGCRTVGFSAEGDLQCTDTGKSTIFSTIKSTPTGMVYNVTLEKGAAKLDVASWSGTTNTTGSSVNKGYLFQATGFVDGDFSCNDGTVGGSRSGCSCTTEGGCSTAQ